MKVYLDTDEYYPYHYLSAKASYAKEVEVDDETLRRWRAVLAAFDAVQDEMAEVYEGR